MSEGYAAASTDASEVERDEAANRREDVKEQTEFLRDMGDKLLDLTETIEKHLLKRGKKDDEEDRRIEEGITLVSPLLAEVKEIAEELKVLEQEEYVKRMRDSRAHTSLFSQQLAHIVKEHDLCKQEVKELKEAKDTLQKQVASLSSTGRALEMQVSSLTMQLRHSDLSLKDKVQQLRGLEEEREKRERGKGAEEEEKQELISDLAEDLLGLEAEREEEEAKKERERIKAERAKMREEREGMQREVEELRARAREAEEERKRAEERVKELEAEKEGGREGGREEEAREIAPSPRTDDPSELRARLQCYRESLTDKDEEINELHRLLLQIRPQLEKEVGDQVRTILEQAEEDAKRIRAAAQTEADAMRQHAGIGEGAERKSGEREGTESRGEGGKEGERGVGGGVARVGSTGRERGVGHSRTWVGTMLLCGAALSPTVLLLAVRYWRLNKRSS